MAKETDKDSLKYDILLREITIMTKEQLEREFKKLYKAYMELNSIVIGKEALILKLKREKESKSYYEGYQSEWTLVDKICFVLKIKGKTITTKEVMTELLKIEPKLKQRWENPVKSVAEGVYKALKLKRVVRDKKIGNYGYTYALPEWIGNDFILIQKHSR